MKQFKAAADPVGHYARPDVVRLLINRTKRSVLHEAHDESRESMGEGDGTSALSSVADDQPKGRNP